MDLTKIVSQIKEKYPSYLTKLDQLDNESYIREVVNQIWQDYLSLPEEHKPGEPFRYLMVGADKAIDFWLTYDELDQDDYYLKEKPVVEIISSDNIHKAASQEYGYIVNINWQEVEELYLPEDFNNQRLPIIGNLNQLARMAVSFGEGILNTRYQLTKEIAEEAGWPFVDLNKRDYKVNYQMTNIEVNDFITDVIVTYLGADFNKEFYKQKDKLVKRYRRHILETFQEQIENNSFDATQFQKQLTEYINQKEGIKSVPTDSVEWTP